MLIPFNTLVKKYDMKVKGILHIGAHFCEELESYNAEGCKDIVWIDALTVGGSANVLNYVVWDKDDEEVEFKITNNGQSSSVYDFGSSFSDFYPNIKFIHKQIRKTKTIETIYKEHNISHDFANFLNIDIQGAELNALKGMGNILNNFDYLYLEVNKSHVYKDCPLVEDIDQYVETYGFYRNETKWTPEEWGDAFYTRKKNYE